ncbi:MAG: FMN-binding protein [Bacteroidetes bacterium]|nr:FMN-binding protein [Bacteroidota bacterium]
MIKKLFFILVVVFFSTSFLIPEKVVKKADKVIGKFYEIKDFSKEVIIIPYEVNSRTPIEFGNENLFKIIIKDKLLGYGYIGNAQSRTSTFDYLVLFDKDFIIIKTKVLIYREDYGGEIGSKRWLRQFTGKSSISPELEYNKNIIPISGATISVRSMTRAMNDVLRSIGALQKLNLL